MTRIVAGAARGRRLAVPARGTRPASERVREAVFNTVEARLDLDGAYVLDLYAGSGAFGLEALSRGAARARFVESDRRAAEVLRRNAAAVGLAGVEVTVATVDSVLARDAPTGHDLVLVAPPYRLAADDLDAVLASASVRGWLAPGALLVVERSSRSRRPNWPAGVNITTERRYGDTAVYYGSAS